MDKKHKLNIDVSYVAALARIKISSEEKQSLQKDMNEIVTYIDMLSELDVTDIQPTMHAIELKNVWREDVSEEPPVDMKERLINNAPASVDGELIRVPQVIPGDGIS